MPTSASTSADRAAISSLRLTPCARIASLNCAPIVLTGFSAFIALCMTTEKSRQRIAASCFSVIATRFLPLNRTLPPLIPAGGVSSWAIGEQQRGLAAAGLADDADELAPADRE